MSLLGTALERSRFKNKPPHLNCSLGAAGRKCGTLLAPNEKHGTVAHVTATPANSSHVNTLVIGAGIAGLAAASALHKAGRKVTVLEKGRGLGGRLATRRIGSAVFDHGAQFMTARDPEVVALLASWHEAGAAVEWCRGFSGQADGHPRWRGHPGMTAFAKQLAAGIDVRLETQVSGIALDGTVWRVETAAGPSLTADALILTAPVPQALTLLDAGNVPLAAEIRQRLEAIRYERCLAVMAALERPSLIPPPGGLSFSSGPIAWLADNQKKGTSPEPAITLHASPEFSLKNWERDKTEVGRELLEAAAVHLGTPVKEFQVHGWRYSRPISEETAGTLSLSSQPPLWLAGDAFAGPKIEGAMLSGWAAARALLAPAGA